MTIESRLHWLNVFRVVHTHTVAAAAGLVEHDGLRRGPRHDPCLRQGRPRRVRQPCSSYTHTNTHKHTHTKTHTRTHTHTHSLSLSLAHTHRLVIMGLKIQRMPAPGESDGPYGYPDRYPHLSVCTPSCHDMSTVPKPLTLHPNRKLSTPNLKPQILNRTCPQ